MMKRASWHQKHHTFSHKHWQAILPSYSIIPQKTILTVHPRDQKITLGHNLPRDRNGKSTTEFQEDTNTVHQRWKWHEWNVVYWQLLHRWSSLWCPQMIKVRV